MNHKNIHTGYNIYKVWKKYEDVAVHFNDLILRLRSQALAGVAGLAAIVFVLKQTLPHGVDWPVVTVAFAIIGIFWIAVAILDVFYYNRLLLGAVKAILYIEELSLSAETIDRLELSQKIKEAIDEKWRNIFSSEWRKSMLGPILYYGIVLFSILVLFGLSSLANSLWLGFYDIWPSFSEQIKPTI